MPTPDDFRRIALAFPGAEEGSHRGHSDFRVGGKVFATLGYPDDAWGMVSVTPEQQEDFMAFARGVQAGGGGLGTRRKHFGAA